MVKCLLNRWNQYVLFPFYQKRPSYLLLSVILSTISFVLLLIFDVLFLFGAIYYAVAAKNSDDGNYGGVPIFYWLLILLGITCKLLSHISNRLCYVWMHVIQKCSLRKLTVLIGYFWTVTYSIYRAVKELAEQPPTTYQGVAPGVSQDAGKNPA